MIRQLGFAATVLATWFLLSPALADRTIVIRDDPGGRIDKYVQHWRQIARSRDRVAIDGVCNSACTLLLGAIPRSRICVTARASLGFHAGFVFDRSGYPHESPQWTQAMWGRYPAPVQGWIRRNGGLTPNMIFLRGAELEALYSRCQ